MFLRILCLIALVSFTSCKPADKEVETIKTTEVDKTDNDILHLESPDGTYTNLAALLEEHKGKVVYVDYWASWCKPCRVMMPASAKLKERYKGKDVVFLYISIDTKRNAWEKANQEEGFTEHSYIATNYPKAKIFQLRNVSSIPRYMLYDKNGRMIDDNAMRPVQPDLITTIDGFLSL
ncbi:TlpA family protein disulfide reductase [Nonlabens mediterrranea]|uniref:TlpA family protein disulfide reductase n=1 Tax=Nonlabens mediterrranea TaxID=1419947 RepID=A0ABS0A2H9_9FLAO|nr:TlpA family protein disulfide reductase [Nonlabens mediterrranea]